MQKTEITLSFDGEKLDALEFYLKKENTTVQKLSLIHISEPTRRS